MVLRMCRGMGVGVLVSGKLKIILGIGVIGRLGLVGFEVMLFCFLFFLFVFGIF